MRKRITILLLLIGSAAMAAPIEHENILKLKYGFNNTLDPYLSPLRYSGQEIGIGNEWWQNFKPREKYNTEHWQHVGKLDIAGQRAYNSAKSNLTYSIGVKGGWGAHYRWTWDVGNTQAAVWVGPYLQADIMGRYQASSVNKPASIDVGIDAMAMGGADWIFHAKRSNYRIRYELYTNLIGMQFAPDYWQSYYEISEGQLAGDIRFSAPHNRNHIHHQLSLDIQLPHSTWRIGAEHEWLRYSGQNMVWQRNQICLVLGCIWQYKVQCVNL